MRWTVCEHLAGAVQAGCRNGRRLSGPGGPGRFLLGEPHFVVGLRIRSCSGVASFPRFPAVLQVCTWRAGQVHPALRVLVDGALAASGFVPAAFPWPRGARAPVLLVCCEGTKPPRAEQIKCTIRCGVPDTVVMTAFQQDDSLRVFKKPLSRSLT